MYNGLWDGPSGADIIRLACDEANNVVKHRRSGEMMLLNWFGLARVPVATVEEHQSHKLRIPVQVLVGKVDFSTFASALFLFLLRLNISPLSSVSNLNFVRATCTMAT